VPSLPFREALQSGIAVALMLCAVAAPVVISVCWGWLPHYVAKGYASVKRFTPSATPRIKLPPGVKGTTVAPACMRFNLTRIRGELREYFNFVGCALFLLSSLYASVVMGQPVEHRYFFLELLLAGGRLKAFLRRYCAVLAGVSVMVLASAVTASLTPYLNYAYGTLAQAIAECCGFTALAMVAGASLGVMMSLLVRSVSGAFLASLGFVAVTLIASSVEGSGLASFVLPTFTIYGGGDPYTYLAVTVVVNVLSLIRVVRIEY